eukprot:6452706-Amphidinium_carterae.1
MMYGGASQLWQRFTGPLVENGDRHAMWVRQTRGTSALWMFLAGVWEMGNAEQQAPVTVLTQQNKKLTQFEHIRAALASAEASREMLVRRAQIERSHCACRLLCLAEVPQHQRCEWLASNSPSVAGQSETDRNSDSKLSNPYSHEVVESMPALIRLPSFALSKKFWTPGHQQNGLAEAFAAFPTSRSPDAHCQKSIGYLARGTFDIDVSLQVVRATCACCWQDCRKLKKRSSSSVLLVVPNLPVGRSTAMGSSLLVAPGHGGTESASGSVGQGTARIPFSRVTALFFGAESASLDKETNADFDIASCLGLPLVGGAQGPLTAAGPFLLVQLSKIEGKFQDSKHFTKAFSDHSSPPQDVSTGL